MRSSSAKPFLRSRACHEAALAVLELPKLLELTGLVMHGFCASDDRAYRH